MNFARLLLANDLFLRSLISVLLMFTCLPRAWANCTSPAAGLGSLDFQSSVFKYCDGTTWQNLVGGTSSPGGVGTPATSQSIQFNAVGVFAGTASFVYDTTNARVGIGSTTPRSTLDVLGTILGKPAPLNGTATIDFSTGNLQYTTANCGTFALHNMKDGGSFSFAVQGGTSATCVFNAFSDAGSTGLTMHLPQDHGPTQGTKHTIYTFMVMGTHAYAQWIPGY